MTIVLHPDDSRTGIGLVQGDIGPGDTKFGRYLYAVTGCHGVEVETVVMSGLTIYQRCSRCHSKLEDAPHTPVRLDMSRQVQRNQLSVFVQSWTGLVIGTEVSIGIEWDMT